MGRAMGTVEKYLYSPGTERHEVVSAVWDVTNKARPNGCAEGIASDMTGWIVPLERFSGTYNNEPNQLCGPGRAETVLLASLERRLLGFGRGGSSPAVVRGHWPQARHEHHEQG